MKLINVYKAAGQLEAEMIKAFLKSQEIPVTLNQESVGRTIGLSAGRLGEVQVLVPESYVDDAKKVLQEMSEGKFDLADEEQQNTFSPDDQEGLTA